MARRTSRVQRLRKTKSTTSSDTFAAMLQVSAGSDPLILISEGDSWYGYPNYNLIDHIEKKLTSHKINYKILRLEDNGDEAVAMLAREQRHNISQILLDHQNEIDLLFFCGGGNDIVGEWDLPFIIRSKPLGGDGSQFENWIRKTRLKRRVDQIRNAYLDLVDIRDDYSPKTIIVTHTYDQAIPDGRKAKFFFGLFNSGPWLLPYLKHIPSTLHQPIVDHILGQIRPILKSIAANRKNFIVVDTVGTLRRDKDLWANELHPTRKGFKLIGDKIWAKVSTLESIKYRIS